MKKLVLALLALVVLMLAACSSLTVPYEITDNPVGPKTGEVTAMIFHSPFGDDIVLSGDTSYSTAAANGGVTKIATVEHRTEKKLFITKLTTIVTGN